MTSKSCPECRGVSRRNFLHATSKTLLAASAMPRSLFANPSPSSTAETAVTEFEKSLTAAQKSEIVRAFDDDLRKRVNANWHITKPTIGSSFYSDGQRRLIDQIIRGVTSEEGYERLKKQTEDDDGGFDAYSVALFGQSGNAFEWVLTGRHLTLRADGNSVENAVFGGPVVYGHGEESSADANLFYYQTKKVNEVFAALSEEQAKQALLEKAPREDDVAIRGNNGQFSGLQVGNLSSDQKALVRDVIQTLLAPYRAEDGAEALSIIDAGGGIDQLRFAFYSQEDLGKDRIWDIWRIEGPSFVTHFRGAPHVHAYLHVATA